MRTGKDLAGNELLFAMRFSVDRRYGSSSNRRTDPGGTVKTGKRFVAKKPRSETRLLYLPDDFFSSADHCDTFRRFQAGTVGRGDILDCAVCRRVVENTVCGIV